jgi:hypothetical protein
MTSWPSRKTLSERTFGEELEQEPDPKATVWGKHFALVGTRVQAGLNTIDPTGNLLSRFASISSSGSSRNEGEQRKGSLLRVKESLEAEGTRNTRRAGTRRAGAPQIPPSLVQGPGVAGMVSEQEEANLWLRQVMVNLGQVLSPCVRQRMDILL